MKILANNLAVIEHPAARFIEARCISAAGDSTLHSRKSYPRAQDAHREIIRLYMAGNMIEEDEFFCSASFRLNYEQGEILAELNATPQH